MYKYVGLLVLLFNSSLYAQHNSDTTQHHHAPALKNLKDFFLKGHAHGHIRNYFMSTINHGALQDYYTNAIGGAISYHTANWHGIELGVKGIFTFKTFSSRLDGIDSISQRCAIWEMELYDVTRPSEGLDLDRLEELYIRYQYRNSNIRLGKIDVNKGPLLLKRDGRMKPFVYNGVWLEVQEITNHHFYIGWLYQLSPRGMTEWYPIREAIGLLNNGYQPNGNKAHYQHHLRSAGLGVVGYESRLADSLQIKVWNYYLDKINNTTWLQIDYQNKYWYVGLQYALQWVHPHQSTLHYNHRFQQPHEIANVIAAQLGYKFWKDQLNISFAYAHSFGGGRFLFAKEMGREDFYVSHARSWLEGYAQRSDYLFHIVYTPLHQFKHLSIDGKLAWVDLPHAQDYQNNKYGKTDYLQTTLEINYTFEKILQGLKIGFLYTCRYTPNTYSTTLENEYYSTNLHHFNLITEICF